MVAHRLHRVSRPHALTGKSAELPLTMCFVATLQGTIDSTRAADPLRKLSAASQIPFPLRKFRVFPRRIDCPQLDGFADRREETFPYLRRNPAARTPDAPLAFTGRQASHYPL